MTPGKSARKSPAPLLLIIVGALLIFGSAAWFVFASGRQAEPASSAAQDIPYPEVPRVTVKDAKAALDIGNAIFVDTRGDPLFSEGHITGALSITSDDVMDRLDELDPAAWIITYCT